MTSASIGLLHCVAHPSARDTTTVAWKGKNSWNWRKWPGFNWLMTWKSCRLLWNW